MTLFLLQAALFLATLSQLVTARVSHRHTEIARAKRGDCTTFPDGPNIGIRNLIVQVSHDAGVDYVVQVAVMCAAIQESGINNLDCGSGGAFGILQQTPGDGWGTLGQILDPTHATQAFLAVAGPIHAQKPRMDAGEVAYETQQAAAGNLYTQHIPVAEQYIAEAEKELGLSGSSGGSSSGGDGTVNVESGPSSSKSKPAPAPAPPSSNSSSGSSKKCKRHFTAKRGDTCIGSSCFARA
jgi:hypothetical protein